MRNFVPVLGTTYKTLELKRTYTNQFTYQMKKLLLHNKYETRYSYTAFNCERPN